MPLQVHVADDVCVHARVVSEGRAAEPRMKLGGNGAASGLAPPLEDDRLQPGLREIVRGDEAVVTAANDYGSTHARVSTRIFMAALRPGAPMMPPPGWVAEPHM